VARGLAGSVLGSLSDWLVATRLRRGEELPTPRYSDTRVTTFNAANGNSDPYRTAGNRDRIADVIHASQTDIVAMQEHDVGNGRTDGLDTALRTGAQIDESLTVFLEGEPGVDYEVAAMGESCTLPCKW